MKQISKGFSGVQALDAVNFTIATGEVHALMGENGAGKSTLIKVLNGVYQRDAGQILFDGEAIDFKSPWEAQMGKISTVFQEVNLEPYLSVAENVFIGREPKTKWGTYDWKRAYRESEEILAQMGINVDVRRPINEYSVAIQQMVAIARAVSTEAKLVIMDEPTSSLDESEVQILFNVIRKLKETGVSIVFISHRMDEIYTICDRVTVLRDGTFVGQWDLKNLSRMELISHMIGRALEESNDRNNKKVSATKEMTEDKPYTVKVRKLKRGRIVNGISFEVAKGEILGLAGLLGSGRTETVRALFSADSYEEGEIEFEGQVVKFNSPYDAIRAGIGYCSENRKTEGIIPNMSVRENITIANLPALSNMGIVSTQKQKEIVDKYIERLGVKTPTPDQQIGKLSGGNQQKVLLARWLCINPKLLILDEPTRGIDVGAKAEIEKLIRQLADSGISIIMISSELEELVRNSDRLVVLRDGYKIAELDGETATEEQIMHVIAEHSRDTEKVAMGGS
ncbi:MAG: sugar ABC transporter ATP-binding protein [Firmicutes bacterium]|nr:sugar ABC transporter ATP-binding protein [Bacillota bacterium]